MFSCIWCKKLSADTDIEHIIPEALGCPEGFVLSDGAVCRKCNNDLAHLDVAVIAEFDIAAFMAGVPGKRGRPPKINSRGNMVGSWSESGAVISINVGRSPVRTEDGRVLAGFGKSRRNIKASLQRSGNVAGVSFQTTLGEGSKFARGIVKIAFSSLAFFLGPEKLLADEFDPIRRFVIDGYGMRKIILMGSSEKQYRNQVWRPLRHESGDYYAITFRLYTTIFVVDLSPDMRLFPIFKDKPMRYTALLGGPGCLYNSDRAGSPIRRHWSRGNDTAQEINFSISSVSTRLVRNL